AITPASRAVCSGSPFATAPRRIRRSAAALMRISPRARASRVVTALSPTSTIRALPRGSTCESVDALRATVVSLGEVERKTLQRHGQVDTLQLDVRGHFERARREVEDGFDSGGNHLLHDRLRVW